MTTKQKLVELKKLAGVAGPNIYQRARIANEVLADKDWIAEQHEGDEFRAIAHLESEFFADLRGYITLGRLRELITAYSEERTWKELRYDLSALEAKHSEEHGEQPALRGQRTSWKAKAEQLSEQVDQLMRDRARDRQDVDNARASEDKMQARIRELENENANLLGRICELEKLLKRDAA